ncbi:hypothetical protein IQ244_27785 [Nostoc sp. LEGE 06077]|uniref:hypothetical protein n=1 Tax=Nostoc sp. LEGE 06077 TaxID=915325 RepID=UPI0018810BA5|nr:hypothetical protein [Nostoc sp. LEGE 06077]MBE9210231.1 hypothetical protein [Nostoc sp. LEGE 06077]
MNDEADFKMPYRIVGKTDLEVMRDKYQRLHNDSYGLIVRFTNGSPTETTAPA